MKALIIFVFVCVTAVWAQTAPPMAAPPTAPPIPDLPDQAVIAQFDDGSQLTMGDFRRLLAPMPPQNQQFVMRDPRAFVRQIGVMRTLAHMAEKQKLDQQSPYREQIEFARLQILANAKLTDQMTSSVVEPDELIHFYDATKEKYKQVKVRAIYISFGGSGASNATGTSKPLTEEEALAKATRLLNDIRGGANFVNTMRDNSDDETSKAKDGDFGTWSANDNIPDALRSAVFTLKQGEVSQPVRQPNGFYLLKADEVTYKPLADVRNEVFQTLKGEHYGKWMKDVDSSTKVEFPNAEFLGTPAASTPPAGGRF